MDSRYLVGCCCAETACLWPTSCSPIQLSHFTGLSAALTSISTEMSSDKPYAEEAWDVFVGYRAHMEREWDLSPSVLMSGHMHSYDNESMIHSERGSDWKNFIMMESREDVKERRARDRQILTAAKKKACDLAGCVAFAYCPDWGVQFYQQAGLFGADGTL